MSPLQNASQENKRKIRNDIILVAIIIIIAVVGFILWHLSLSEGVSVSVKINGVQTAVYPLSEDREVIIAIGDNEEHRNVLVIKDSRAYISEADCPDRICVKTRAVTYVGETIVCLPHKLIIEIILSDADSELDAAV